MERPTDIPLPEITLRPAAKKFVLKSIIGSRLDDTEALHDQYGQLTPEQRDILNTVAKQASGGDIAIQELIMRSLLVANTVNEATMQQAYLATQSFAEAFQPLLSSDGGGA